MARWAALLLLATAAVLGLALAHPGHDHGNNDDQDSDALRMFHHSGDASAVNFPSYSLGMDEAMRHRRSLHVLKDYTTVARGGRTRAFHASRRRSIPEVTNYRVNQPYPDQMAVDLDLDGTVVQFDLEINREILANGVGVHVVENGVMTDVTHKVQHVYYQGTAKSSLGEGRASLSLYRADGDDVLMTGTFLQDGRLYTIHTKESFERIVATVNNENRGRRKRASDDETVMIVYRDDELERLHPEASSCGVEGDFLAREVARIDKDEGMSPNKLSNPFGGDAKMAAGGRGKRLPAGCNANSQKVIYVGFAADCSYSAVYSNNIANIWSKILDNVNTVNGVYNTMFNYALGVREIQIHITCGGIAQTSDFNELCSDSLSIQNRLNKFSFWRGGGDPSSQPTNGSDAALWHLMSNCPTGSTVGIAWLNMLCTTSSFAQGSDTVSGTAVSTAGVPEEWRVVAHEIGHNIGAMHDCLSTNCPCSTSCACCQCSNLSGGCDCQGKYIMNPTDDSTLNEFSPCTQAIICQRSAIKGTCLGDPGSRPVLNTGVCGNGVWEPPEECDCGGASGCANNTCCRANCTLIPPAQCSDSNSACCSGCKIRNDTSVVCRPVANDCDVAEKCDGVSARCPTNKYVDDGTACTSAPAGNANTYCATGVCTNRVLQCKEVVTTDNLQAYTQDCSTFAGVCQLACQSDTNPSCQFPPGFFLNGTKCGDSGTCSGGVCSNPDLVGSVIQWIMANLALVISLAVIVFLLIVGFLVWGCRKAAVKEVPEGQGTRVGNFVRSFTSRNLGRQAQQSKNNGNGNGNGRPTSSAPPNQRPMSSAGNPPRSSAGGSPRPSNSAYAPPPMNPEFAANGNDGSHRNSGMQMGVRCPHCGQYFPSEQAVNAHLDTI